jgi:hypothetical protein
MIGESHALYHFIMNETNNSRIDKKATKKQRKRQKPNLEKSIWPMKYCQIPKRNGAMTTVSTNRISTILTLGLMVTVTEEWPKRISSRCLCDSSKEEEGGAFVFDSRVGFLFCYFTILKLLLHYLEVALVVQSCIAAQDPYQRIEISVVQARLRYSISTLKHSRFSVFVRERNAMLAHVKRDFTVLMV